MKKYLLFIILCALPCFSAEEDTRARSFRFRDIFSYEHPVEKSDHEKKWYLDLFGGYTEKKGNTETERISYSGAVKYDNNITAFRISYNGFYGKTGGIKDENRGTGTLNFSYYLLWRMEVFIFSTAEYNEIIELEHRNNSGGGIKFLFIRNRYVLADLSGAPVYQYEKFEQNRAQEEKRWSLRGRIELNPFNDEYMVRYYFYYIPEIGNSSNYRTIHDFSASKKIMGNVHFRSGYRREFNTYDKSILEENPLLKKTDEIIYMQLGITI